MVEIKLCFLPGAFSLNRTNTQQQADCKHDYISLKAGLGCCNTSFELDTKSSAPSIPRDKMGLPATNCTMPPAGASFVGSPNIRGTLDIVWSCLLTILLSSWSILCLNIPADGEGFWHRFRRKHQSMGQKISEWRSRSVAPFEKCGGCR